MKPERILGQCGRFACGFIFFLFLVTVTSSALAEIIPTSRLIDWSLAGAKNDWTQRSSICATLSPSGGNDTTQIVSALNSCPAGQVVKLNAGTFRISTGIQWPKSGISLRGSGSTQTTLQIQSGFNGTAIFDLYSGHGSTPDYDWTLSPSRAISSGLTKGSTQIVTSVAHGWVVGDYVLIDQTNQNPPWNPGGYYGSCTWCSRSNGGRLKGQVVQITSVVNTTTVNFTPPLYDDYSASYSPQGVKASGYIKDISIESMTIDNSGGYSDKGVYSYGLYNSVFYDLDFVGIKCTSRSRMFWLYNSSFNTIKHSTMRNANCSNTNNGYGLFLGYGVGNNLIEDNILHDLVLSIGSEGSNSGNVIAYNYAFNPLPINGDTSINSFTIMGHGAGSWYNLYEGNVIANSKFRVDAGFGSQHSFTLFRNRISQNMSSGISAGRADVDIEFENYYFNLVGNVLGSTKYETTNECFNSASCTNDVRSIYRIGYNNPYANNLPGDTLVETTMLRHGNWDSVTNGVVWDPSISDHTIPASLFLASKPSWWGTEAWPPIGPDVSGFSGNIPAKSRFEGTYKQGTNYTVTPSAGPNGSISPNALQSTASGSTVKFNITPNSGFSASVGGTCGGSLVGTTYTTNPITADCTVSVTFTLITSTPRPSAPVLQIL
jgi:hypothetical protein